MYQLNSLKLDVYDFVATIFIGVLLIIPTYKLCPNYIKDFNSFMNGLILLIFSYISGRFIQQISRMLLNKINKYSGDTIRNQVWSSLSTIEQEKIKEAIKAFYGFDTIPNTSLESLCISPVIDKMGKRDAFVAIADFNRSMALITFICALYALIKAITVVKVIYFLVSVCMLGATFVFLEGYRLYTMFGPFIIYHTFLSWWREQILRGDFKCRS